MNVYIKFVKGNKKKLIALLILINIFAVVGLTKLNINTTFDIFKVQHSQYQEKIDEMEILYGGNDQTILLVESKGSITSTIKAVSDLLDIQEIHYTSPNEILDLLDQLKTSNMDTDSIAALSPVNQKGDATYITFILEVKENEVFESLIEKLNDKEITYYMSGDTYMQYEILNLIVGVLMVIPPLALSLVLLTFRSQLSSFKAAVLSVMPAGLSALWTLGLVGWIGGEVSIMTVLAPIFAIVIGSADGLHFVSHMEEELSKKTPDKALEKTLSIVGMPMIVTTTTSIAGFIGLMFIDTSAIKDLAFYASIGVLLAGIITWYVLPLIFTSGIELKHKEHVLSGHLLKKLWGKASVGIAVGLLLLAVIFIPNIKTEFNQLMFFRDFTQVQKSFNTIVDINGGAIPLYYYGEFDFNQVDEKLPILNDLLVILSKDSNVNKVINPFSMIPNLESLGRVGHDMENDYIRIKNNKLFYRIMVFPVDLDNNTIVEIENLTFNYNETLKGQLIGSQFLMKEMNESLVKGQIMSIAATFLLITIMLFITLKSFKLTIISSLPIVLTSIMLYGFLGITGISLNLMTCTIFSITLGIGVDYAIHFTSVFKYYSDLGENNPIELAFKYTSRPVIANAFGLSLGLSALWLSPLLIHLHLSALMWVSMTIAVFMSLTLLPTMLKRFTTE